MLNNFFTILVLEQKNTFDRIYIVTWNLKNVSIFDFLPKFQDQIMPFC
jgi:hypothetical protein